MKPKKVAVLVGSLRKESFNKKIAKALMKMAPENLNFEILEIGYLPLYNQDLDEHPELLWTDFREQLKSFDAVLFVTPEYNRSVPGVLKNAIDVGSRPHGKSVWEGMPGAVISVSIGAAGGFGANHHLRQSMVYLNMPCMPQPEAYIGNAHKLFYDNGELANEDTKKFLQKYINAFSKWVELHAQAKQSSMDDTLLPTDRQRYLGPLETKARNGQIDIH